MNTQLIPIVAPGLSDPDYGRAIDAQFENINHNFNRIVSVPFLQGKEGSSLYSIDIVLSEANEDIGLVWRDTEEEITYKDLYLALYKSILGEQKNGLDVINGISWSDNLPESTITLLYVIEDDKKKLVSSLMYNFKDARFTNIKPDSDTEFDSYIDQIDMSCIITFQSGEGFIKNTNIPRLYYDKTIQSFCWYLNGYKTGVIASGPQGMPGSQGNLRVVTVNEKDKLEGTNQYLIDNVLIYVQENGVWRAKFKPYIDLKESGEVIFSVGDVVIVFLIEVGQEINQNNEKNQYWITTVRTDSYGDYVDLQDYLSVSGLQNITGFLQSMQMIGTDVGKSIGLNGLFIPINPGAPKEELNAHLLSRTDDGLALNPTGKLLTDSPISLGQNYILQLNYDVRAKNIETSTVKAKDVQVSTLHLIDDSDNEHEEDLTFQILKDIKNTTSSYAAKLKFDMSSYVVTYSATRGDNVVYYLTDPDPLFLQMPGNDSVDIITDPVTPDKEDFVNQLLSPISYYDNNDILGPGPQLLKTAGILLEPYYKLQGKTYILGERAVNSGNISALAGGLSSQTATLYLNKYEIPNSNKIENTLQEFYPNSEVPIGATISIDICGPLDKHQDFYLYKNDSNLIWTFKDRDYDDKNEIIGIKDLDINTCHISSTNNMGSAVTLIYIKSGRSGPSTPVYNVRTVSRWRA